MDKNIIVTGGDINKPYERLNVISFYHPHMITKKVFGKDLIANDTFQAVLGKLKEKAAEIGADAIIYHRAHFITSPGAMAVNFSEVHTGTAIKFNEE